MKSNQIVNVLTFIFINIYSKSYVRGDGETHLYLILGLRGGLDIIKTRQEHFMGNQMRGGDGLKIM